MLSMLLKFNQCLVGVQVTAALTSLLSLVMGRVPDAILRKKFQPCVKVLRSLLDVNQDQVTAAILCPLVVLLQQDAALCCQQAHPCFASLG